MAPFYDELMRTVPYRMWADYYLLLLARQSIRPRRLLDVCCGTGTMCELLAAEGFEASGFDISEPMVAEARAKAAALGLSIRYEVQDAATLSMGETYGAAFSFFDSLNYICEIDRLRAALGRIAAHIEPGGSFVFDLNTAFAFEQRMFDQRDLRPRARLRYDWHGEWDSATRLIAVHMLFWKDGEEFEETHIQRAHTDEEVRSMLGDSGFVDVQAYHSYTLQRPRKTSDRVHYACVRG